ncbi:hypothetical protein CGC21_29580 [Leishmania donovani]|uniref:Uncharacterized protein n=1 Tax=Leishmania donovani TaxID=5661 RepID=A0A504XV58_LEIDO|nr:hypothetical protein CGC21_29580 [Leishmania donovani]
MSEFQRILSPAQLTKHYEVLQFLSRHPNQPYTLAQLDSLLPRGVAVQRFPAEWFALVEDGACWHRSIELHRTHSTATTASSPASSMPTAEERARYVLLCARAVVNTLDELCARIESPSTLLDPEGCVALHTDQIVVSAALIRRAVHMGLVYYFPDTYDKSEFKQFGMRDASSSASGGTAAGPGPDGGTGSGGGGSRTNIGQVTASLRESFLERDEAYGGGNNVGGDRTYIALPPGVCVQHRLLTRRGVPEQEAHSLPTRFYVGERVLLLFDNLVAVKKLGLPNKLRVEWSLAGVRLKNTGDTGQATGEGGTSRLEALAAAQPQPLRIRRENVAVRNTSATTTSAAMDAPAPIFASTKVKVEIEAVQACTLKLILTVNGLENVLNLEVQESAVSLPGVLVLRDRHLDSFALPEKSILEDPIVNPSPSWRYPYESVLHAASSSSSGECSDDTAAQWATAAAEPWTELVPLPWTQNPSPAVLALREATYPTQDVTVRAATRAVFSAQSLADEARLRQTKERMPSGNVDGTPHMARARLCLFLLFPRVASASPPQRNQPFMPRITSATINAGSAARGAAASARAQSTSPHSTENGAAADTLDMFPYDAENCGSSMLAPLPYRRTTTATRDFARPRCLCRPIAMSMESVSSWEEDAKTSSVSGSEGGCYASARRQPAHASMMGHPMCRERSPQRVTAQPTGSSDGDEGNIAPVSALHRLNAHAAATLSQQSTGVSDPMTHSAYNKHDIPRELQRLIDHTDRGIEQLYQLAGRSTAASTVATSVAAAGSSLLQSQPPSRRPLSPASTPHRTLNFSNGTAPSSPASLAKPPRHSRRPDLHPPPSHVPDSFPPPPWQQRHSHQDHGDLPLAGGTSYTLSSASFSGLRGSSAASSPSPTVTTADTAAYRAHMAAQQSTQRPNKSSTAHRRRSQQQPLSGASMPTASTSLFMSPGSTYSGSRDESSLHTRSGLQKASGTASSGMLGDVRATSTKSTRSIVILFFFIHDIHLPATPPCAAADLANIAPTALPYSVASATAFADARVAEQLRAELEAKEEAMLRLRMDHAREMAELRQSLTHERANAAKQTADELATSFSIKQQLLQSSLQTERERLMEAEEQLRLARREAAQRKMELEDSAHALQALQSKYATLAHSQGEHAAQAAQWREWAEKVTAEVAQLESQVKVWKAKEVDWQAREAQLQLLAHAAEERREKEETSARTALAQVEAAFTQTSQSYQDLLAEATKRMSYLEKSHRKYKLLKEAHTALKTEYEQLVDSSMHRARQSEAELVSLRAEAQELRQQLRQRDSATQEETASHQEMLSDYKRRLELQEANAAEQVKTLQHHIDTASHTIELLRSQMDSLKQDLIDEQSQHQQMQMKAAQAELQWKETQHEQQRTAAAYKVRTEDTIAQLKRQLRDKDTKMQALAASAAEPVQRLRQQLDDERGRRARLEEQFRAYKKKAKEAKEQAASEMRREQLRAALLTPMSSAASSRVRFAHSATATPSPPSSSAPCFSGWNGMGGGRKAGSECAAWSDGPAHPAVRVSARGARDDQRESRFAYPAILRTATAPASSVLATASVGHAEEADAGGGRRVAANHSLAIPRTDATRFSSEEGGRLPRPAPSAAPPPHPSTKTVQASGEEKGEEDAQDRWASSPSAVVAASVAADASAISPSATVESLSGISRTSPCTSTLMPGEDDAVGVAETEGPASTRTAEPTLSLQPRTANSPARTDAAAAKVPAADEDAIATHVYADSGAQAHEHRMSTFHTSASEVLRRIAGSREEFLAQCAAIVKSTAAASRRGAQARRRLSDGDARTAVSGDNASASEASQSDDETDDQERL